MLGYREKASLPANRTRAPEPEIDIDDCVEVYGDAPFLAAVEERPAAVAPQQEQRGSPK